jgi:outer membrane protein assembly factor BamE (lipoprotein component of BamABCDE complex)
MTGIITDKKNAFTKYLSKSLRLSALTIATSLTVGQISCAPIVSNVGYVFDEETLNQVTVGSSSKEMVRRIMGSPSTIASVDGASYYYISSRIETNSYKKPEVTDRKIVAVYFDDNDIVSDIGGYGLEDGNIVAFVESITTTRGKELSLLAQLFGNLGRFNSGNPNALPSN